VSNKTDTTADESEQTRSFQAELFSLIGMGVAAALGMFSESMGVHWLAIVFAVFFGLFMLGFLANSLLAEK
jgi:hypothetical protein